MQPTFKSDLITLMRTARSRHSVLLSVLCVPTQVRTFFYFNKLKKKLFSLNSKEFSREIL